jgi:tetratricopeptide (TPR) repeat protein
LNGLLYEARNCEERKEYHELVELAYRTAMDLDPTLWIAYYLRGMNAIRRLDYQKAQQFLTEAYIHKPNHADTVYALAYASYYAYDVPLAMTFIAKALELKPKEPAWIRAAAVIYAAAGQHAKAKEYMQRYQDIAGKRYGNDVVALRQRLDQWSRAYQRVEMTEGAGIRGEEQDVVKGKVSPEAEPAGPEGPLSVVFDAAIIQSTISNDESQGQNIFEKLAVSLGGSVDNGDGGLPSPQWSYRRSSSNDRTLLTNNLAYGISAIALTYSLNMLNSTRVTAEVSSNVTLSTTVGRTAYFVQGNQYTGATTGNLTGATIASVDAGVKIEITALSVSEEGEVIVTLTVTGSDFVVKPNPSQGISNQMVQLDRAKVTTTVKAMLGQTIVVGGIHTRQNTSNKTGMPLLDWIPGVKLLTSQRQNMERKFTALFVLTPRIGSPSPVDATVTNAPGNNTTDNKNKQRLQAMGFALGPNPTVAASIIQELNKKGLWDQFRCGDLASPVWAYGDNPVMKQMEVLGKIFNPMQRVPRSSPPR